MKSLELESVTSCWAFTFVISFIVVIQVVDCKDLSTLGYFASIWNYLLGVFPESCWYSRIRPLATEIDGCPRHAIMKDIRTNMAEAINYEYK